MERERGEKEGGGARGQKSDAGQTCSEECEFLDLETSLSLLLV